MRERALAVEKGFVEVEEMARACLVEVFGDEAQQISSSGGAGGDEHHHHQPGQDGMGPEMHRPWGGEGVLFEALTAKRKEAPVVRRFERLGLLGK